MLKQVLMLCAGICIGAGVSYLLRSGDILPGDIVADGVRSVDGGRKTSAESIDRSTSDSAATRVRALNGSPSPKSSGNVFLDIASALEVDLTSLAKRILALPVDSVQRQAALDMLMEKWVSANPDEALHFAQTLHGEDRAQAFKSALLRLGKTNLGESLTWMSGNLSITEQNRFRIWLYVGLASSNPVMALGEVDKLKPGAARDDALRNVLNEWAKTDVLSAFAWLDQAEWSSAKPDIYRNLMNIYLSQRPDDARTFIASLDDGNYWKGRLSQELVQKVANTDPLKALDITTSIADPTLRTQALTDLFEQWVSKDADEAFNQALSMSRDPAMSVATKNDIMRQAAFGMLNENRQKLLTHFAVLPPDIRNELAGPIAKQWMEEDPRAALAWAAGFPSDSATYNLAMDSVARSYENWNPEQAIIEANRMTFEDMKKEAIFSALRNLHRQNPSRAAVISKSVSQTPPDVRDAFDRWTNDGATSEIPSLIPGKK